MKTDWEAIYSGQRATDARMEVSRLTCNVCGGLQEECSCEVSELDNANGPPCKHCAHPILSHDEEFGNCGHLGVTDTGWDICDCPGYEEGESCQTAVLN